MKGWNWKHFLLLLLAIPIVGSLAGYLGRSTARQVNKRDTVADITLTKPTDIQVVVSVQDAEGVTQADLNMTFLKNLETYTVERVTKKTRDGMVANGYQGPDVSFDSEALYVEPGAMKLAVIRLSGTDGSRATFISGIVGKELRRVACVGMADENIPITYGACADKVNDTFGIEIGR